MEEYKDKEWLRKKYTGEKLSQEQIGKLCGVSNKTIGRWLKKFNIYIRSRSEALKGKMPKFIPDNNGRIRSKEIKEKMSRSFKKRWANPEKRKKYIDVHNTPEYKLKMKKIKEECWRDPEKRNRNIEALNTSKAKLRKSISSKKCWENPEYRNRVIEATKKGKDTPEVKLKMSEISKKHWSDPKYVEKILKANNRRPTGIENKIINLNIKGLKYTGNGMFWRLTEKKRRNPDFKFTGRNKIIEVFGNYWYKGENINEIIREYKNTGLDCIVFWGNEINSDIEKVEKKIIEFRDRQLPIVNEIKEMVNNGKV